MITNMQKGFGIVAVVIIVAALALVGGGVYVSSKNSVNVKNDDIATSTISATTTAKVSLRDLLGKNAKCTFSSSIEEGITSDGTAYISGNNFRVDAINKQEGKLIAESHMIRTGSDAYVWATGPIGMSKGLKIKIDASTEAQINSSNPGGFDLNDKLNYNCVDWNPDASKFVAPVDIVFMEMGQVSSTDVNANANVNASAQVNKCAACDMIPDASAKAQCKTALACK